MLMRLAVLIIIFNFMTRFFESNVLNGKYLGGYSMKFFQRTNMPDVKAEFYFFLRRGRRNLND